MITDGWQEQQLEKVAKVIDCKHRTPSYVEDGIPLISPGTIKWGALNLSTPTKRVTKDEYQSLMDHCSINIGDLVLGRNQSVGIAAYVTCDKPFVLGQDTVLIQASSIEPKYLFYGLQSNQVQRKVFKLAGGSTFSRINLGDIRKLPISYPPLPEQKKIAQILSTWDKAIEAVEKLIANSRQKKKALMQQLLTGKKRFPGFEGEWKEVRLAHALRSKKRKGKIVPTNENKLGVPYIGSTSFEGGFGIYTDSSDAVICASDDILVLWDGENAGKTATGLIGAVSSTVVRYCIDESKVDSQFITYNLLRDNYKVRAIREGSGIPHMPGDFEQWYRISLPPLDEQQKIASVLSAADREIETWQQELEHLKQEKKTLMQQLLTGKKRVVINA